MNYVEPIKDKAKVVSIQEYLYKTNRRNYILFLMGIYTGLRISDILPIRIRDIKNKNFITLREKKTNKQRIIEINTELKKALDEYILDKDPDDYLIKSREGWNRPITRDMAYKIVKELGEKFGLENVGTHTLRKTFGYHYYKQTGNIVVLQQIFNHSHTSVTLRYIGINQETINNAIRNFKI